MARFVLKESRNPKTVRWVIYHMDLAQYDNAVNSIDRGSKMLSYWATREVDQYTTREELMAVIPDDIIWEDHPEFSSLGIASIAHVMGVIYVIFPVDKPPE